MRTVLFIHSAGEQSDTEGSGLLLAALRAGLGADTRLVAPIMPKPSAPNAAAWEIHTEVPSEFAGQGIASRLAHGSFELLRKTGRKAILKCPFMIRFVVKHPEYADIVAG